MSAKIHLQLLVAFSLAAPGALAQTPERCLPLPTRSLTRTLTLQPDLLKPFAQQPEKITDPRALREFVDGLVHELRRQKRDGRFECGYTACDNNP
jgi:hypothetical protein